MFKKEEKKPIVKILLGFSFLDLAYEGKWKQEILEWLWLIFSINFINLKVPPNSSLLVLLGWILFFILLRKKGKRIINYAKEYEES
tara:strand:- start:341 stop:598 length:258 start_codon:yes stop_codon:yes gene_type:complete